MDIKTVCEFVYKELLGAKEVPPMRSVDSCAELKEALEPFKNLLHENKFDRIPRSSLPSRLFDIRENIDAFKELQKNKKLSAIDSRMIEIQLWAYENLPAIYLLPTAIICLNVSAIHLDQTGRLHCETGPALVLGNENLYFLNGIEIPEYFFITAKEDILLSEIFGTFEKWGLTATHEIRSELIKLIGAKNLFKKCKAKSIDKKSGAELYEKYPVGNYVQQGDYLGMPDKIVEIPLDNVTKIRLQAKVFYELFEVELQKGLTARVLHMGNPSENAEEHFEFVPEECQNIFEAIIFRNYTYFASKKNSIVPNWKRAIEQKKAFLPFRLS